LIAASFSGSGVFGLLGILHDRRRWLAVLVGAISGGFLLLMLLWSGLT
jgi:hypothetical protein